MPKNTFSTGFSTDFEYIKADSSKTQKFTVVYTHGFCSDPWGRKPEEIKKWCAKHHISFYRYELAGHGSDKSNLEKADFNIWKCQLLEIIDNQIKGPILAAGSSLGGWLSLMAAVERPQRVIGVLGLAAAPDFTKDNEKYVTQAQKDELAQNGRLVFEEEGFQIVVTQQLIDSGNQNLLLNKREIAINCPIALVQGMKDQSVPYTKALKIAEKVKSGRVVVKLLKNSDHRLNSDEDIREIMTSLDSFIQTAP